MHGMPRWFEFLFHVRFLFATLRDEMLAPPKKVIWARRCNWNYYYALYSIIVLIHLETEIILFLQKVGYSLEWDGK